MSQYYVIKNESNLGDLNISSDVFETIVVKTVEAVEGSAFEESSIPFASNSPISITINSSNQVVIDLAVLVDYGTSVPTVTNNLQTKILEHCFEMTGSKNVKVNIEVKGINF